MAAEMESSISAIALRSGGEDVRNHTSWTVSTISELQASNLCMLAIQKVCLFEVGKQVKLEYIHGVLTPHAPDRFRVSLQFCIFELLNVTRSCAILKGMEPQN